ncbi:MAG: hypothetical protein FWH27_11635 [Planctomycetaceae bacterium]|nr:hypothetical protein [Planctomycetaceae bacterium]
MKALFFGIGERVWNVYYAEARMIMGQRIRRLKEWASQNLSGVVLEKVLGLCAKSRLWSVWYDHPDGHATSNRIDRLMRNQNRYFDRGQHFHGDLKSTNLRSRAWAILHNYWPWCKNRSRATTEPPAPPSDSTANDTATTGYKTYTPPRHSAEQKNRPPKMQND